MRMERRRSSLTPCWPRLEAGDTRLEVEEPIFQLEQVTLTTVQCCTVPYCTASRSPSPLYSAVLYCTVPVLYCTVLYCEQVTVTRDPAARDQEAEDTSLPHHHWQRWRPRQVSTRSIIYK